MIYANFYRTQGRPQQYPFYSLQPGETCTIQANPIKVQKSLQYIRRSRGWTITAKKLDGCVKVTRLS